ncbi:nucleotide-binding universal stress UspA family protein [Halohasta litchfieldiae]|jgi:nucleotide-binding universal stress UspA family protein|uniref:Nucleotide-binding universal stress protein, UspA family n=1 Tax=Halohasta litchfieldiae TaxID=1073996 RepID=A0A1H6QYV3_9EURY|nr:universal stress protein [Halohasta litchfieldiae]ATW88656.1 nucleotide-binding universal stress UspA family protein [Halohasta litchfieldiae]SEI47286.1 Nucleotide-binding universal stress protein, UspA family [Halohasta litchfieldiae]
MSLETVLVTVEEAKTAQLDELVETAIDIAGPAGATVVLARVFSSEAYEDARERLQFDPNSEVTPSVVAKRNVTIRELGDTLADAGVDSTVEARLSNGESDGDRLAELADEIDADLAIIGGRGRTPAGKAVFGSTAQTLMLTGPCPVTFVRNE